MSWKDKFSKFRWLAQLLMGSRNRNRSSASQRFLMIVTVSIVFFLVWASVSEFDQVVTAEGKVIPFSKLQTVQHFEGGIIKEIHVKAGQYVKQGEPLVSLSPLEAGGSYQAKRYEFVQGKARIRRLEAEYEKKPPVIDDSLMAFSPELVKNELMLMAARQMKLESTLNSFESQLRQRKSELVGAKRTLTLVAEEHDVVKKLVERGLEPKLEAVRAEKTYVEALARVESILGAIDEINDRKAVSMQENRSDVLSELAKARSEFSQIEQMMPFAADKADRSTIRSPISGVVNRVLVSTVNGVLKAGEPVVEIVPGDTKLVLEAKIKPADIGFIIQGQRSLIKLSTFDYSIFGSLNGRVDVVGSDSVPNEKGETFYFVKVEMVSQQTSTGRSLQLIPGMTAQVDIVTGKRSIISYISSPITKTLNSAFTEK
jgi:adhesin transport system membrane fusion protein